MQTKHVGTVGGVLILIILEEGSSDGLLVNVRSQAGLVLILIILEEGSSVVARVTTKIVQSGS